MIYFSILCILIYTIILCIKSKEIPSSISETFYTLEHKKWFGITLLLTIGLLIPKVFNNTPDNYLFIAFLAIFGVLLVSVAPNFKKGLDRPVHITGAVLCLVFSQVWVGLIYPKLLFLWIIYFLYILCEAVFYHIKLSTISKPLFWLEVNSLFIIYITLLSI